MQRLFTKSEEAQMGDRIPVKMRPNWFRNAVVVLTMAALGLIALAASVA